MSFFLSYQRRVFNKAIKKTVFVEFDKDDFSLLMNKLWNIYEDIPESPLKFESRAVGLMLSSARINIALYKAFMELGVSKEKTRKYIEEINWKINKCIGTPMFLLSAIKGKDSAVRIKWINDVLWKYLFTKPFERVLTSGSDASVAFNITRCPFQEYYRSQGVIDLCEYTSCSQDYFLAKTWRSKFKRKQTLARGYGFCDFRFYVQ